MTTLWFFIGLLSILATAFLLVPQLSSARRRAGGNRSQLNVGLYQEHLFEIEMQHKAGVIDSSQLDAWRAEAGRNLLDDADVPMHSTRVSLGRFVPLVASLSTPLLALMLYLHWGSYDQFMVEHQNSGQLVQSIEKTTEQLEALIALSPDSAEGWTLVGRAYMAQDRMPDAALAFERAANLAGRPPEVLGLWAKALYFADDQQYVPQVHALIDEALNSNPQEAVSLQLKGMVEFQAGHFANAASYWDRLLVTLPEQDSARSAIAKDIERAREMAGSAITDLP